MVNESPTQGQQVVDKDYVHFPHSLPLLVVHGEAPSLVTLSTNSRDESASVTYVGWYRASRFELGRSVSHVSADNGE
jgi:hypothetical protein